MGKIINDLKQTTAAQLFRHITTILMIITPIWVFSGPFIKAYAADALLDVLIEQGVDPKAIAKMQEQGADNGKEIGELAQDADKIKEDLNAVKKQVGKVSDQIEQQTKSLDNVEDTLKQLLLLNQRRTDLQP